MCLSLFYTMPPEIINGDVVIEIKEDGDGGWIDLMD